ncbi:MAG: hypothetical protein U0174_23215 [Polyangiaceae bacterium]
MRTTRLLFLLGASALVTAFACSSTTGSGFGDADGSAEGGGPGLAFGEAGTDGGPGPRVGTMKGKVVAPEGSIPISGALVYLTANEPKEIPSGVYCDKCVDLDSYSFAYTGPDGTFDLPVYSTGEQYFVTQKGQFRRVRKIKAVAGDNPPIPAEFTRLPSKTDPAKGDTIPKIGIVQGEWDAIQDALGDLGIEEFDMPAGGKVIGSASDMSKYHIIFLPCSGQANFGNPSCTPPPVGAALQKNLRDYVQSGGKVYVSDWSYEYVRQTWPGFITWAGQSGTMGSGCLDEVYEGKAQFDDPSLNAWMTAINETNATLEGSWTHITSVNPQPGEDENGKPVTITPKVWASTLVGGQPRPSTVSFQDKCGRVLFSTYHVEENQGLAAQVKALIHILLQVSTCVGIQPQGPK